ncbi:MAG: DUF222 domain-containing protein, partial [Acidimicrobiia bacterium]
NAATLSGMAETLTGDFEKVLLRLRELDEMSALAEAHELAPLLGLAQACVNVAEQVVRSLADRAQRLELWALEGFRAPGRWVALHTGLTTPRAAAVCRQARALRDMPTSRDAAAAGELNSTHIDALTACQREAPEHYSPEIDELLVGLAPQLDDFLTATRAFRECARAQRGGGPDADPAPQASFLLSESLDGWHHGSLHLAPEDAAIVGAALDRRITRMIQARREGDPTLDGMGIGAMRAQALVDLCDADLRRDPNQRRAPDRHRIALTMHVDEHGNVAPVGPVPAAFTCDAELFRMVVGVGGEILDVGRATRTWSPPQADAIIRRDRHCRFPGCCAPPAHCDVHHCQHWEHGGRTAVTNGVLLCRWHHTYLHRHGWSIRLDEAQRAHTYRPDGTELLLRSHAPGSP